MSMCVCLCVLGEEGLRQSRWGYILCFMVTRGRINHCFIKRLQSQSAAPSPPFSLPPSFLTLSSIFLLHHSIYLSSVSSSHPPPNISLSFGHPPLSRSISASCHRPSNSARTLDSRDTTRSKVRATTTRETGASVKVEGERTEEKETMEEKQLFI